MLTFHIIIRDLLMLVLILAFKKKAKCKGGCDNDGTISKNECCTNYYVINGTCKECPAGFFGTNCSVQCPFPSYGLLCGYKCNCSFSECSHILGCWHFGTTTSISLALESDTTFLSMPVAKDIQTEISSHQRTIHDYKFIVVLSVTAVSSVIIVLTLVFTKFRCACNTKTNSIYHSQDTEHHMPLSMHYHGQFQVPFRNSDSDVYLQIEETDEIHEISNTSLKTMHIKNGATKETGLDNMSKPKLDSLLMREKSSSRTNFNNTLEPKPDSFKQEKKSVKKFEKYKTYTTRRLLYSRMNMRRYNSWPNVKDLPEILISLKKAKSDLNIFHFKT